MVGFDDISCKSVNVSTLAIKAKTTQYPKVIKATLKGDVNLGNPSVIRAVLDMNDTGHCHGLGQALMAEAICPDSSMTRGSVKCLTVALGAGASSTWGSAGPVAMVRYQIDGLGEQYINDNAFFWELSGLTGASGEMLAIGGGSGACAATLKVNILGTGTKYIMLADSPGA